MPSLRQETFFSNDFQLIHDKNQIYSLVLVVFVFMEEAGDNLVVNGFILCNAAEWFLK